MASPPLSVLARLERINPGEQLSGMCLHCRSLQMNHVITSNNGYG